VKKTVLLLLSPILLFNLSCAKPGGDHGHSHGQDDHGHGHGHGGDHGHGHGHGHGGGISVTHFSEKTELFVEFEPLVVGKKSTFAAHLTWLGQLWTPVEKGKVEVTLSGDNKPNEVFEVSAPSQAGIFRPVATPQQSGKRRLTLSLITEEATIHHDLGEQNVFTNSAMAEKAVAEEEDDPSEISFLKETAWKLDFAMTQARMLSVQESFRAYGEILPKPEGHAILVAPVAGRVVRSPTFPKIGQEVTPGRALIHIAPQLDQGGDAAALDLARSRAEVNLKAATRDKDRVASLVAQGALSENRLRLAEESVQRAEAEVNAAEQRLAQYEGTQRISGGPRSVAVRTPLSGRVVAISAAPGEFVERGKVLMEVVDLRRLWLDLHIPEGQVAMAKGAQSAIFKVASDPHWHEAKSSEDAPAVLGGKLDPADRTAPLIFEIENNDDEYLAGQSVVADVFHGPSRQALVVPVQALVEEDGLDVVYVQSSGETFSRRVVKPGIRFREWVEIQSGLHAGDWVVSTGAFYVRLAAMPKAAAGHGHAH
jgi:RND family efflux transporter MFP subunit